MTAAPCSFSKKNGSIMLLDQNPYQTNTRFGCVSFSMYASGFSLPTILLVYIPPKLKLISSEKMIFLKIGIFCKSISGPLSETYTQSYSFAGSIKLIICQIRHELRVTIHEISTSWKKNVRWQTLYETYVANKLIRV